MNEEEKKILLKIQKVVNENFDILKTIRTKNRRTVLKKVIYYLILIAIAIYSWHHIKPIYESFSEVSEKFNQTNQDAQGFFDKLNKINETMSQSI